MSNKSEATVCCATVAGLYFLVAVSVMDWSPVCSFFLIAFGTFVDWLPYILGYMKTKEDSSWRDIPFLIQTHIVLAILSYAILVVYLAAVFCPVAGVAWITGWIFFGVWLAAYLAGVIYEYFLKG